jgi:hypothetical protein
VVRFITCERILGKDMNTEMFPVYGGKWLSRKAVYNWVAELAETTVKRLSCCGFRRTAKAVGQVYHCQ